MGDVYLVELLTTHTCDYKGLKTKTVAKHWFNYRALFFLYLKFKSKIERDHNKDVQNKQN